MATNEKYPVNSLREIGKEVYWFKVKLKQNPFFTLLNWLCLKWLSKKANTHNPKKNPTHLYNTFTFS